MLARSRTDALLTGICVTFAQQLYDLDHDGSIDADELFSALRYNEKFYDSSSRSGSTQVTREDVAKIIAHFDVNTNATLDINEFIELFRDDS